MGDEPKSDHQLDAEAARYQREAPSREEDARRVIDSFVSAILPDLDASLPMPERVERAMSEARLLRRWNFVLDKVMEQNPDVCFCGCHYPGEGVGMMHMVACCDPCPGCGLRIQNEHRSRHRDNCPAMIKLGEKDGEVGRLRKAVNDVVLDLNRTRAAIRDHRDQKSDDRCFIDDLVLYGCLPEGSADVDFCLPPKCEFLESCARFWEQRQSGADKISAPAMTIRQLEDERAVLLARIAELEMRCGDVPE
jgi:hypothetical protein